MGDNEIRGALINPEQNPKDALSLLNNLILNPHLEASGAVYDLSEKLQQIQISTGISFPFQQLNNLQDLEEYLWDKCPRRYFERNTGEYHAIHPRLSEELQEKMKRKSVDERLPFEIGISNNGNYYTSDTSLFIITHPAKKKERGWVSIATHQFTVQSHMYGPTLWTAHPKTNWQIAAMWGAIKNEDGAAIFRKKAIPFDIVLDSEDTQSIVSSKPGVFANKYDIHIEDAQRFIQYDKESTYDDYQIRKQIGLQVFVDLDKRNNFPDGWQVYAFDISAIPPSLSAEITSSFFAE